MVRAGDTTTFRDIRPNGPRKYLVHAIIEAAADLSIPIFNLDRTETGYKLILSETMTQDEKSEFLVLVRTYEAKPRNL